MTAEASPPTPADLERPGPPTALARAAALSALAAPPTIALLVQGPAPLLLRSAPLLLLALHPYAPWHVLVSARTSTGAFVAVYVTVRALPCLGDYFVGRWYGPRVLDRLSRRRRIGRLSALVERLSRRAGGLLLLLFPGVTASVLAGSNAMPLWRFVPLMTTGIVLAAVYVRTLAAVASPLVDAAADAVERHAVPLAVVLTAGVVLVRLRPWRRWRR